MFKLSNCTWEEIKPIWQNELWPGREDVEPVNSMCRNGGHDKIIKKAVPYFLKYHDDDTVLGVISGHISSDTDFRVRGIFVYPEYRKQGISQILFAGIEAKAIWNGSKILWSYPKIPALNVYLRYGFTTFGEIETTGFSKENIRVMKFI